MRSLRIVCNLTWFVVYEIKYFDLKYHTEIVMSARVYAKVTRRKGDKQKGQSESNN